MPSLKVAFWNVENLFDHERASRDPNLWFKIKKEIKGWNARIRDKKIVQLGYVLRAIRPALIGLSEVENEHVLKMLAKKGGQLKPKGNKRSEDRFQAVGHPSPDKRGIDVCFLYDQTKLDVVEGGFQAVAIGYPTRDLVWAKFKTKDTGDDFIAIVTHWPSRANPSSAREKVAREVRKLILFLKKAYGKQMPIIVMGDLNDDSNDKSVKTELRAQDRNSAWNDKTGKTLFNVTEKAVNSSVKGTHNYQGKWATLDHIIVSRRLLEKGSSVRLKEGSEEIFAPDWVRKNNGTPFRYGRPKKAYNADGYSDHFAVSIVLEY